MIATESGVPDTGVPSLQGDQVLVCYARPGDFDGPAREQLHACLDGEEQERLARFRFERDRHIYLVAHALTRALLARALGASRPETLHFVREAHGRPELADAHQGVARLRFNLSHTQGLVACGVCWEHDIGVDVEQVERRLDMESLAPTVLGPGELENLRSLPMAAQRVRFFEFWTLKEAYLKAVGEGLGLPLRSIDFQVPGPSPITGATVRFGPELDDDPERLRYLCWPIPPGHQLSLAVGGPPDLPVRLQYVSGSALLHALQR